MKISFSEIRQAFGEIRPREIVAFAATAPFKLTAFAIGGLGLVCFAKAADINIELKIGGEDIADLTDDRAILVGAGITAIFGACLVCELGELLMRSGPLTVIKNRFIIPVATKGGRRHKKTHQE